MPEKKSSRPRSKKSSSNRRRGGFLARVRAMLPPRPQRGDLVLGGMRLTFAGLIIAGLTVIYFAASLPNIRDIDTIRKQQGITIEASDGTVVANYGDVYGEYIPYDKLPKSLIYAVIATEDRRFFEHHGIDLWGILRAMVSNIMAGHVVQGGSTITQQVAKNVFLTPQRSIARKIEEALLALWLEARFSKKEIMAIYLNRVYLGSATYGVDAAAKRYFNKSARTLTLEESAMLAGLLKAPSRFSPTASPERARERMRQVLLNMVDAGYLKQSQVAPAVANFVKSPAHQPDGGEVRYYTDWVLDILPDVVGQVNEDLIVTTTLNRARQQQAVDALQSVLRSEGQGKRVSQGAVVVMRPSGAVEAVVGGLSYAQSQYNRATQAKRQPGSIFKLFVYLAALEAGMTPNSLVLDAPIALQVGNQVWAPDNYSNGYKGDVPLYVALRESLNTAAVRLSQYAGIGKVAAMAMRLGIPNVPERPSIALGAVEATLMEMTAAFAHLPNDGNRVVPYAILSVRTRAGNVLYQREAAPPEPLLAKGIVEMMNYMLLNVVQAGTGTRAALPGRPVAGKTGTSQEFKDAWFVGFTPQLVAGVWVGNDDNQPMKKITGGSLPAKIWHTMMAQALEGQPVLPIPNQTLSSDGVLPWLFGGDAQTLHGDGSTSEAQPPAAPAPASSPDIELTPSFWDKLNRIEVPKIDKSKLRYEYPTDRHDHRVH